jgi:hypothetical protein
MWSMMPLISLIVNTMSSISYRMEDQLAFLWQWTPEALQSRKFVAMLVALMALRWPAQLSSDNGLTMMKMYLGGRR